MLWFDNIITASGLVYNSVHWLRLSFYTMICKVLLITVAVGVSKAAAAEYSETSRGSSYVTPSPTPFGSEPSYLSAESKSYKEDDRRSFSDGPSHPRTGPPKKLGPAPLTYSGGGVPLISPHRGGYLPPGAVIGYLAYPQPLVHAPLHAESVAHPHATLLPSAAFSHIAYAAPIAYPHHQYKPLTPHYNSSPSSSHYSSSPHHSSSYN